jgi:hypothetical protein
MRYLDNAAPDSHNVVLLFFSGLLSVWLPIVWNNFRINLELVMEEGKLGFTNKTPTILCYGDYTHRGLTTFLWSSCCKHLFSVHPGKSSIITTFLQFVGFEFEVEMDLFARSISWLHIQLVKSCLIFFISIFLCQIIRKPLFCFNWKISIVEKVHLFFFPHPQLENKLNFELDKNSDVKIFSFFSYSVIGTW